MCVNLVLLAKGTALDIAADEGSESGPPKFGGNQLTCLQEAGVASGVMVVATLEDGTAKRVVCGDIDMAFVSEDTGFDLPVCELGTEEKGNVFMHGLESLENERITRRCGFNAMGEGGVDQVDKKGLWEEGYIGVVGVIHGEKIWVVLRRTYT